MEFHDIVPLSAGNVLVIEDYETAVKWLGLEITGSTLPFFQKPSLKVLSRSLRADTTLLKSCNCHVELLSHDKRRLRKLIDPGSKLDLDSDDQYEQAPNHLASGEKEGDELKRNAGVPEILKSTQFQKICKTPCRAPERIVDHDRVIWLGDLNYRVSLSYEETRGFLEENDWDTLLEKDQVSCSDNPI
ncbi:hypothetical protein FEM48_Zijuj08G0164700 [Ziziphus jujuba var. spinosa]|uniref:Inositol polyphosphate-related phosphatase domain-containing protein n=1 Tax=Ziziphus jujuba var. spinosa TaxID=714518 RepID=A0A978V058_ZIZJJ|nr:hypothetical protein FEM48_Zijuj08G0164700 [Ziziphus jujuba var. spinosa]